MEPRIRKSENPSGPSVTQLFVALLAIALITLPARAPAQTVEVKASGTAAGTRAAELNRQAVALYSVPARAGDAARLHVQEVSLRTASDPEAVTALVMAANLYSYSKQPITARKTMERAAERALAIGDVVTAAQAFTNAAFLAHENNNASETQRLGRKAVLLSESPVLSQEERTTIRNRFRVSPVFASLLQ
jgi:hypothetical protein